MEKRNPASKYLFDSPFAERKTLEYLQRMIHSRFLYLRPAELFQFSSEIFGRKETLRLINKTHPSTKGDGDHQDFDKFTDTLSNGLLVKVLSGEILQLVSERSKRIRGVASSDIEKRLAILRLTFKLTRGEVEILVFHYLLRNCRILEYYMGRDVIADFSLVSTFRSHGDNLLRLKRGSVAKAFCRGALFQAQILETAGLDDIHVILRLWVLEYLSGLHDSGLSHAFLTQENDGYLDTSDFEIPKDELTILETLANSRGQQNILFYGRPGTGKTSFAKALAKKYGKSLCTVKVPETNDPKERLAAIYAAVNIAHKSEALILIDEADEILNCWESPFFKSKFNKSWVNTFLESHQKKIIWITNRTTEIDPSTMRRFSFSLEFRKFNARYRLKVMTSELKKRGLSSFFSEDELKELCHDYEVNADGIVSALSTLQLSKKIRKEDALQRIRTILRNHARVTQKRRTGPRRVGDFTNYSLEGLNTSSNLETVLFDLRQYLKLREADARWTHHAMSLLLYGMPGTGKSEFVYYLGNLLGKEVYLRRCSEIQSCWVGETEKNIADAFHGASEEGSLLFFDEADTFLYPRKEAHHSWEKSFTNEILTQIESYTGIVIFATNDIDGLDHAALRRFRYKIEFLPLTPEGNWVFYNRLLNPLVPPALRLLENEIGQIRGIRNLTPGDFTVVKERFFFTKSDKITHELLIKSLLEEVRHKRSERRVVGFGR